MSKKLYIPNPYNNEEWTKIEEFAKKTNNQNIIYYYKEIKNNYKEEEYQKIREYMPLRKDYYYNRIIYLLEDNKISSAAFIEGYNDERKCYITFSSVEEKEDSLKTLLVLTTNYAVEKLKVEHVGITIKTSNDDLIEFAINNNYDVIDKDIEKTKLIKEITIKK